MSSSEKASTIASFFDSTPPPANLPHMQQALSTFLASISKPSSSSPNVVLITSGGTTVPLEQNTVRFLDNFSTGTRGAAMAERYLQQGYAVIFLHRTGSTLPFLRRLPSLLPPVEGSSSAPSSLNSLALLQALQISTSDSASASDQQQHVGIKLKSSADSIASEQSKAVLNSIGRFRSEFASRFLSLEFVSIVDYLFSLRLCCCSLKRFGRRASVMLAAAVSDFYIPSSQMVVHKMDSRAGGALELKLDQTPKVLYALRHTLPTAGANSTPAASSVDSTSSSASDIDFSAPWLPEGYVCSFKLETDSSLLLSKSQAALNTYLVNGVLTNQLQTRYEEMSIIEPSKDVSSPLQVTRILRKAAISSSSSRERVAADDPFEREVEVELVQNLCRLQQGWILAAQ